MQKGELVLVHAAASGVGTSLLQLCKMYGCPTVAVSSSQEKLDACIALGASAGVNYKEDKDWA